MAKGQGKTRYFCQECGYESLKWLGKCPGCGAWNTFVEELAPSKKDTAHHSILPPGKLERLAEIEYSADARLDTGIEELNRVLGGGLVAGELVLLSGDPGIGKSTLVMQLVGKLLNSGTILYISGEESGQQLKMRAERLGVTNPNLLILTENNLDVVEQHIQKEKPAVLVLDSIQTVYLPDVTSAPGSVSQLRECTNRVLQWAKGLGISVVLIGHVTKDGSVAGPRVLEHMVDAVLYFEGDRHYQYRILRALKNRFGSTNEIGVFEMQEQGLMEITNPSATFLSERSSDTTGAVVVPCMEGTRPMLVEMQALVAPSFYGQPRRTANGTDYNRLAMLLAVLEKRIGMKIGMHDIYINVVGGLKVDEPAVDLAVVAALASSFSNTAIPTDMVVLGEVGLTGEIRGVHQLEKRLMEAAKMGFRRAVIPSSNFNRVDHTMMQVIGCSNVAEALQRIFEGA